MNDYSLKGYTQVLVYGFIIAFFYLFILWYRLGIITAIVLSLLIGVTIVTAIYIYTYMVYSVKGDGNQTGTRTSFSRLKYPALSFILGRYWLSNLILIYFWRICYMLAIGSMIYEKGLVVRTNYLCNDIIFWSANFLIFIYVGRLYAIVPYEIYKMVISGSFTILLFRKFSQEGSAVNKEVIAATFGAFGDVWTIWDENWMKESIGGIHNSISRLLRNKESAIKTNNSNWKLEVEKLVKYCDFVVFDWTNEISKNMIWEMMYCINIIPLHRILCIVSMRTENEAIEIIENNCSIEKEVKILQLNLPPEQQHTRVYAVQSKLLKELKNIMKALEAEERTSAKVSY